jgi:hypothetical protein
MLLMVRHVMTCNTFPLYYTSVFIFKCSNKYFIYIQIIMYKKLIESTCSLEVSNVAQSYKFVYVVKGI